MSPKFEAEEGGTSWVILMATISSCQGVQELWDRLDWYALATDSIPSIQTRVWDSERDAFGSLLHYLPSRLWWRNT